MQQQDSSTIERHPWPPFMPEGARVLIMGSFPPQPKRWAFDFYYPNRTNDFWPMIGLIFCNDRHALYDSATRSFRLEEIKRLLTKHHIALHDTCRAIRRLRDNASDKYLEIVEQVPLYELLSLMPQCRTIATTGEKAASVVASITDTEIPAMGNMTKSSDGLEIWRMPSTSRAYPLALEKKASYYARMFAHIGIINN